jgi:hypothetical protein
LKVTQTGNQSQKAKGVALPPQRLFDVLMRIDSRCEENQSNSAAFMVAISQFPV